MCNQTQSISMSVISRSIFGQNTKAIALLFGQNWLSFITFQCAIKINQFQCRSFFRSYFGQNTKAIALRFGQNWLIFITFQCAIKINQFQFRSFLAHFWAKYQGYSLTFWPKLAHFHHFSMCNQNQSISNFSHFSLIFGQNTKAIALLFGQNWLICITFQCAIKINQFQCRSFLAHFWAKYQGYSLTFWPKLAHFHHFSMCNQNQSISMSVISRSIFGQNTKAIALLFGQNRLIFITFQCAIKINQFQFRSFFAHFWAKLPRL